MILLEVLLKMIMIKKIKKNDYDFTPLILKSSFYLL